ncbi:MAG TPA: hypothetical protein VMV86_03325 [Methanosarcinales archaeon]|nr:hypothetical protein [Methanosarcinales archaeon]
MYDGFIDMLYKKCTRCGEGKYKLSTVSVYENLYVVCNSCAYEDERFKIKENYYVNQEAN